MSDTFPRSRRIRSSQEFEWIYAQRQRAGDDHLLVFAAANGLEHPRLGLSVSKKHGNAVRRARLKRLLREAFRLSQHELPPGLDLILIPRQGTAAGLEEFRGSLVRLVRRLAKRLGAPAGAAVPRGRVGATAESREPHDGSQPG